MNHLQALRGKPAPARPCAPAANEAEAVFQTFAKKIEAVAKRARNRSAPALRTSRGTA